MFLLKFFYKLLLTLASILTSFLALSSASTRLYFSQRTGIQSDFNAPIKTTMIVIPFIILLHAVMTFFWSVLTIVLNNLIFIFLLINWLAVLSCTMIRRHMSKNKDETESKNENTKIILTTVFTSWISPVSVWTNSHKSHCLHLLVTNTTNIIFMYAMTVLAILIKGETHSSEYYITTSILAAIVLCCAIILQIFGNPHNIYKVSKYCCCCTKPIVTMGMICDFLDDPAAFYRGSIYFISNVTSFTRII